MNLLLLKNSLFRFFSICSICISIEICYFSLFEFGFELNWVWCKQEEPSGFLSLNRVMSLDRFVLTYKDLVKVTSFRNYFYFNYGH